MTHCHDHEYLMICMWDTWIAPFRKRNANLLWFPCFWELLSSVVFDFFAHPLWAHLNVSIVISVISVLMIENDVHFETTYLNYMKPS